MAHETVLCIGFDPRTRMFEIVNDGGIDYFDDDDFISLTRAEAEEALDGDKIAGFVDYRMFVEESDFSTPSEFVSFVKKRIDDQSSESTLFVLYDVHV